MYQDSRTTSIFLHYYSIVLKVMEKFTAGIQTKGNSAEKVSSCYEKNRGSSQQRGNKCYMLHQSFMNFSDSAHQIEWELENYLLLRKYKANC